MCKWYELQVMCYECSGGIEYCRTLDDVADILAFDAWNSMNIYGHIRVRTISDGLPKVIDKIGWNYAEIGDDDIEHYIANTQEGEEILAYTYYDEDYGREMVIFIFLPKVSRWLNVQAQS